MEVRFDELAAEVISSGEVG
jgi:hypothetical protein